MDDIDMEKVLNDSMLCPIYPLYSELLSPRGIIEAYKLMSEGSIFSDEHRRWIVWCDLCGMCSDTYEIVKEIRLGVINTERPNIDVKIEKDGLAHIVTTHILYRSSEFGYLIDFIVDRLGELGLDIGVVTLDPGDLILLSMDKSQDPKSLLDELSINRAIVLDKYSYKWLKRAAGIKILRLSQVLNSVVTRSDIYPIKIPNIKANLLNSAYKFYRIEYRNYLKILSTLPSIDVSISKERFGSAFIYIDHEFSKDLAKYIMFKIPPSAYIVSTVDPYLYLVIRRHLRKRYAISFTPALLAGMFRRL